MCILPYKGTGKTLIARRLAQTSGMDYAILSGGDVAPLGEDAVNQLHALFRWAERSAKGLIVFIDEAEAFLSARLDNNGGNSHLRNALNALLYQTGTPSRSFMLVLATNRPEDLDPAILDRIDVSLSVALPAFTERAELLKLYLRIHVQSVAAAFKPTIWRLIFFLSKTTSVKIEENCITPDRIGQLAKKLEGFSGREIAKLCIAIQYAMLLADNQQLTTALLLQTVSTKINEHAMKQSGFKYTIDKADTHTAKVHDKFTEGKSSPTGSSGSAKQSLNSHRQGRK